MKKLFDNFKLSIADYKIDNLQKSKHWQRYYNSYEKFKDYNALRCFRKNLSRGIEDTRSLDLKSLSAIIEEIGSDFVLKNLINKNIGESDFNYKIFDNYIDINELVHIYWFKDLSNYVFKDNHIKNICEIGAGYGLLARIISNNIKCKYIIIDLPEANLLSSYYLSQSLINKKFYLYEDYKNEKILSKKSFLNNDIFILPPWINIDKDIKIDLFINTRSMMEMNFETIQKYFRLIQKNISNIGYFFNINCYIKSTVGHDIKLWEYPYDKDWEVILSKKSFGQEHIHCLLTQRRQSKFKNNIKQELIRIQKLSKDYLGHAIQKENIFFIIFKRIIKKTLLFLIGKKFLNKIGSKLINLQ